MSSRLAGGDDELGQLLRHREDLNEQVAKLQPGLAMAAAAAPTMRSAEALAQERLRALQSALVQTRVTLQEKFPGFSEMTLPQPLGTQQVARLLLADEAMLVHVVGKSESWLWVVRQDGAHFIPLTVTEAALSAAVRKVRAAMEFGPDGAARALDLDQLHTLYRQLLAPAEPYLNGVTHVLLAPSGPLQSLPLSMLIATPPAPATDPQRYRNADWLASRYAVSVLPAVSSLRALRQTGRRAPRAQSPFIGFGDRLFKDTAGPGQRSVRRQLDAETVLRKLSAGAEIADVRTIRAAPRLARKA